MERSILIIFVLFPAVGYLLGAIPFGLIIGLSRGVDIRKQGSGNIGSTNVGRVLGKKWGYLCFVFDVAKGLLPVLLGGRYLRHFYELDPGEILPVQGQVAWLLIAAACIFGHMFSLYLRFRGGKGVATSLGVVLGIWPFFTFTAVLALLVWIAIWGMTRYVSLASMLAALAFPLGFLILINRLEQWNFSDLIALFIFSCLMAALVIVKHRSNITRLLAGTENRGK
jgi:glycerol-3-phosphate acyltransferase PlsY